MKYVSTAFIKGMLQPFVSLKVTVLLPVVTKNIMASFIAPKKRSRKRVLNS